MTTPPKNHDYHTPQFKSKKPDTWLSYHLAHLDIHDDVTSDPNCALYFKGRYHLFYIYPHDGGPSFAHVSSTDMVYWKWHPTTLTPKTAGHGMYSGTAFITKEGRPAIIYHGADSKRNQIKIALDDDLDQWSDASALEVFTKEGVVAESVNHWDPDIWLDKGTYYAIYGGSNPSLISSTDLEHWELQGPLFHHDMPQDFGIPDDIDVSCANMFKRGNKWVLLCIDHGLGARYYLGDFKDGQFLPYKHCQMNWAGWDFFAPESLLTPDDRRVMWAWCSTRERDDYRKLVRHKNFPELIKGRIQVGIQSLPRELSLVNDQLQIKPLEELKKLRYDEKSIKNHLLKADSIFQLHESRGDTIELEITMAANKAEELSIEVLSNQSGKNGFKISTGINRTTLSVGYIEPPFQLRNNEKLCLNIFIDKSMIEVFANDRQAAVAWHEYNPDDTFIQLSCKGEDVLIKNIRVWHMKSIYTGELKRYPR